MFRQRGRLWTVPALGSWNASPSHVGSYVHTHIYLYICVYVHKHVYLYICVSVFSFLRAYTCVPTCAYMFIYTHVYKYIYTYICMHIYISSLGCGTYCSHLVSGKVACCIWVRYMVAEQWFMGIVDPLSWRERILQLVHFHISCEPWLGQLQNNNGKVNLWRHIIKWVMCRRFILRTLW